MRRFHIIGSRNGPFNCPDNDDALFPSPGVHAWEIGSQGGLRPVGTLERGIPRHGFNRPSGTNERISRFLTQR